MHSKQNQNIIFKISIYYDIQDHPACLFKIQLSRLASRIAVLLLVLLRRKSQNINLTSQPASEWLRVKQSLSREPCCEGSFDVLILQDLAGGRLILDVDLVLNRVLFGRGGNRDLWMLVLSLEQHYMKLKCLQHTVSPDFRVP